MDWREAITICRDTGYVIVGETVKFRLGTASVAEVPMSHKLNACLAGMISSGQARIEYVVQGNCTVISL